MLKPCLSTRSRIPGAVSPVRMMPGSGVPGDFAKSLDRLRPGIAVGQAVVGDDQVRHPGPAGNPLDRLVHRHGGKHLIAPAFQQNLRRPIRMIASSSRISTSPRAFGQAASSTGRRVPERAWPPAALRPRSASPGRGMRRPRPGGRADPPAAARSQGRALLPGPHPGTGRPYRPDGIPRRSLRPDRAECRSRCPGHRSEGRRKPGGSRPGYGRGSCSAARFRSGCAGCAPAAPGRCGPSTSEPTIRRRQPLALGPVGVFGAQPADQRIGRRTPVDLGRNDPGIQPGNVEQPVQKAASARRSPG